MLKIFPQNYYVNSEWEFKFQPLLNENNYYNYVDGYESWGEDSTLFWQSLSCTTATLQYLFSMASFLTPGDAEIG